MRICKFGLYGVGGRGGNVKVVFKTLSPTSKNHDYFKISISASKSFDIILKLYVSAGFRTQWQNLPPMCSNYAHYACTAFTKFTLPN